MKITRFQKIKNHRIFRDFSWPGTELPDFGSFNLIYGWNGSGKTTLSNLFRYLQDKQAIADGEVTVVIDGDRKVTQADIPTAALPQIRVFNRDTVSSSIFEVPGQTLPPVFYLGEDSAEIQKQIETLKNQQLAAENAAGNAQNQVDKGEVDLDAFCRDQARAIKNLLTVPGGGPYNNYNASPFRITADSLLKQSQSARLLSEQREKYLATKTGMPMSKIDRPVASYPDFIELTQRVGKVLERSIVSSVIDELRDDPAGARWMSEGLRLHTGEHATENCRFCNQPLPAGRLQQLEGHFNDAYSQFQSEISTIITEIDDYRKSVSGLRLSDKALLYPNMRDAYDKALQQCSQQAALVKGYLEVIQRALKAKSNEPFRKFMLSNFFTNPTLEVGPSSGLMTFFQLILVAGTGISSMIGKTAFDQACTLIDQHNNHSDNFEQQLTEARNALEKDAIAEVLEDYRAKLAIVSNAKETLAIETGTRNALGLQIKDLERSIRHHQPAAEELTKDMQSYLGRDELSFEAQDAGYLITRHGEPALHLSEGERTAIAFMYFLKSLQDTSFDLKNGVVVIDDPISSLDANSLYSAFGFMKERIQDAKQVFVLTHNFTFFRQVKNWFNHIDNIKGSKKPNLLNLKRVRFYMLKSQLTESGRGSVLCVLDELLHQFESEYHHLFQIVLDASQVANDTPMGMFYALPNSSRRLLEAVLAFKQPAKTGELFQQLKDVQFDEAKKARILRFTNTYSHHGFIAEQTHDLSVLAETPDVMKDVLALIKSLDPEHFNSMSTLCSSPAAMDIA